MNTGGADVGKSDHLGELEGLVMSAVLRTTPVANGVAVYREIEERARRDPGISGVHVTLRRLESKGYLTSVTASRSKQGGRPRRFYAPTPAGLQALRECADMWTRVLDGLTIPEPASGR